MTYISVDGVERIDRSSRRIFLSHLRLLQSIPHEVRSLMKLVRFQFLTSDKKSGFVHDLIFDDDTWMVRYCVIHFSFVRWLFQKLRAIPIDSIQNLSWNNRRLNIPFSKEFLLKGPVYQPGVILSRLDEEAISHYFGLSGHGMGLIAAPSRKSA